MEEQQPRRRASSATNRLKIALTITWLKLTGRRWFIEYTGDRWELITD